MVGTSEPEQFRKLFIGGLDFRTTDDTLRKHFEQWGELVDVVVMKDVKTKRSKGFGFITYAEESMLDDAQNARPHKVDGREVETKRAIPREESGKAEANVTVKKLFIGGLKDEMSEEDLQEHFGQFGAVKTVSIVTERGTDKKRGFGFIEFDDYDSVDKCILRKNQHNVKGRRLDVKKALSKQQMQDIQNKQQAKQGFGGGGGGYNDGPGGGGGPWGDGGGYGGGGFNGGGGRYGGDGGSGGRYGGGGGGGNRGPWGNQGGGGGGGGGNWGNQGGYGGGNQGGGNWGNSGGGDNWGNNQGGGGGGGGSWGNNQGGGGGGWGNNQGGGGGGWGNNQGGGGGSWGGNQGGGGGGGNFGSGYQQGYGGGPMSGGGGGGNRPGPYSQGRNGGGSRY